MNGRFESGVTLLGGGPWRDEDLTCALARAPRLICADGAANALAERRPDMTPDMIVGDLDSLDRRDDWAARIGEGLVHVAEQDSTDFQKCLSRIAAPFVIGVGFIGGRIDHELAVFNALVTAPRPIVLIGEEDVIVAAPTAMTFAATPGQRVSVFPLRPVAAQSTGLRWPLDGLPLAPGGAISTSNEASSDRVALQFDRTGALVILPKAGLDAVLEAIGGASGQQ